MYTGPNIEQNHLVFAIDPASGRGNRCSDLVNIYSNTDAANPSFNGGATYTDNVSNEGVATMEFVSNGQSITYGTDNGSRSQYDLTINTRARNGKAKTTTQPNKQTSKQTNIWDNALVVEYPKKLKFRLSHIYISTYLHT